MMKYFTKSTSKYPGYTHVSWNLRFPSRSRLRLHRYVHLSIHRLSNGVEGIRLHAEVHRFADLRKLKRVNRPDPTQSSGGW